VQTFLDWMSNPKKVYKWNKEDLADAVNN